jgi:hypothetical protein
MKNFTLPGRRLDEHLGSLACRHTLLTIALLAPLHGTPRQTGRNAPMKEISLSGLTIVSPLAFPLTLKSGQVIETDAASYFGTLTEEKRGCPASAVLNALVR